MPRVAELASLRAIAGSGLKCHPRLRAMTCARPLRSGRARERRVGQSSSGVAFSVGRPMPPSCALVPETKAHGEARLALRTDQRGARLAIAKGITSDLGLMLLDSISRRRDSVDVPWLWNSSRSSYDAGTARRNRHAGSSHMRMRLAQHAARVAGVAAIADRLRNVGVRAAAVGERT